MGEGSIPFLEVGSTLPMSIHMALKTSATSTILLDEKIGIRGCTDHNPFFVPVNRVQVAFYVLDGLIAFFGVYLAYSAARRLKYATLSTPRKLILYFDGTTLLITGTALFLGYGKQ